MDAVGDAVLIVVGAEAGEDEGEGEASDFVSLLDPCRFLLFLDAIPLYFHTPSVLSSFCTASRINMFSKMILMSPTRALGRSVASSINGLSLGHPEPHGLG